MIDEAHATGILGDTGSGASEMFGVQDKIDICMGTLSKAIGSVGGYIAGSSDLIDYLKNRARSFIFDTSLPAGALTASIGAIKLIERQPSIRDDLNNNIQYIQDFLASSSFNYLKSVTPIVPIIIGDEEKALECSKFLLKNQIYVPAVRPPSVPKGQSRIRVTLMATHKKKHINKIIKVMENLEKIIN